MADELADVASLFCKTLKNGAPLISASFEAWFSGSAGFTVRNEKFGAARAYNLIKV
jgi:hypothetical protein